MVARPSAGFSLLELLVTLALVATLAGLASASYQGYLETARRNAAEQEAARLALALEAHHLHQDSYVTGVWTPNGEQGLAAPPLGWSPADPERPLRYEVAPCDGSDLALCYRLTVTRTTSGEVLVERSGP